MKNSIVEVCLISVRCSVCSCNLLVHWLLLCRKGTIFLWMGKEGVLSQTDWHRDNMIYSREYNEFCIKLSLHFAIDGVGI